MPRVVRKICLIAAWSHRLYAAESLGGRTELRWETIPGCPSEREVAQKIEERLGQALDAPREQSLRLHARVIRNGSAEYELVLVTEGSSGTGQRTLSNESCWKLAEAASLVMAIAIDPKRVQAREAEDKGAASAWMGLESLTSETPITPHLAASDSNQSVPEARLSRLKLTGKVSPPVVPAWITDAHPWSLGVTSLIGKGILPKVDLGTMATAAATLFALATFQSWI